MSPNQYAVLAPNQEEREDNFEIIQTSNFDKILEIIWINEMK